MPTAFKITSPDIEVYIFPNIFMADRPHWTDTELNGAVTCFCQNTHLRVSFNTCNQEIMVISKLKTIHTNSTMKNNS